MARLQWIRPVRVAFLFAVLGATGPLDAQPAEPLPVRFFLAEKVGYVVPGSYRVVVPPSYSGGTPFSEAGYAAVTLSHSDPDRQANLFIDRSGRTVARLPAGFILHIWDIYYGFSAFGENPDAWQIVTARGRTIARRIGEVHPAPAGPPFTARFLDGRGMTYIDASGSVVLALPWINGWPFSDGRAVVRMVDEDGHDYGDGIIDESGATVREPRFEQLCLHYAEGLCWVQGGAPGTVTGYLDRSGAYAFTYEMTEATNFENGVALVKVSEVPPRWDIIDRQGNRVAGPLAIEYTRGFREGIARVTRGRLYGYLQPDGTWLAEPIFDAGNDFSGGYAQVLHNGREGLLSADGMIVWSSEIVAGTVRPVPVETLY